MIKFEVNKHSKEPENFVVSETKQWICKTCDHSLKREKLPAQAKVNNLDLEDIPSELSGLNSLKVHLISLNRKCDQQYI